MYLLIKGGVASYIILVESIPSKDEKGSKTVHVLKEVEVSLQNQLAMEGVV